MKGKLRLEWGAYEANEAHRVITSRIIRAIKDKEHSNIQKDLVEAAQIRKFLG